MREVEPIPAEEKGRKFSKYLVTINSNVRARTDEHRLRIAEELKETLRYTMGNELPWRDVTGYPQPQKFSKPRINSLPLPDPNKLLHVDISVSVEVGHRQRRTHIHAVVTLRHKTKVRLFKETLQEQYKEDLHALFGGPVTQAGIKNPYIHLRFIPAHEYYMDYIAKHVGSMDSGGMVKLEEKIRNLRLNAEQITQNPNAVPL